MQLERILAVLALLAPLAAAETDAGLWRFVHPNAKALIGVDVRRIRNSHIAGEMSSELRAMPLPFGISLPSPGKAASGSASEWMQLINSVDRVVVSSPGRPAGGGASTDEPPLLIALAGQFEPVKLSKMLVNAGCRRQTYGSVVVYRPQDAASSDFGFVILNSQTLLIGDAKSLFLTIDRLEKNAAAPPAIVARARDLDVAYDFWAVLSSPPSAMSSERFPLADLGAKINGFEAGIAVRDGLAVDVDLNTVSETAAKEISTQFTKLTRLAARDRENHPEWQGIDRKLKVRVDRSDVHFAFRLTEQDVSRMAKSFNDSWLHRAQLQAKTAGPAAMPNTAAANATAGANAAPPQKMFIRIDGLDSGPREIPYHNQPNR